MYWCSYFRLYSPNIRRRFISRLLLLLPLGTLGALPHFSIYIVPPRLTLLPFSTLFNTFCVPDYLLSLPVVRYIFSGYYPLCCFPWPPTRGSNVNSAASSIWCSLYVNSFRRWYKGQRRSRDDNACLKPILKAANLLLLDRELPHRNERVA